MSALYIHIVILIVSLVTGAGRSQDRQVTIYTRSWQSQMFRPTQPQWIINDELMLKCKIDNKTLDQFFTDVVASEKLDSIRYNVRLALIYHHDTLLVNKNFTASLDGKFYRLEPCLLVDFIKDAACDEFTDRTNLQGRIYDCE